MHAALGGLWDLLRPFWSAIIVCVVTWTCMLSALGKATESTVTGCIHAVFALVLSGGALEFLPELVDSSIATAGDLAGVGGAQVGTPLEIAAAGVEMYSMASDHAAANIGFMPWSFNLISLVMWLTGVVLLACYVLIALLVGLCMIELLVGAVVLSPAYVFLAVPGFNSAAWHPASHLLSCTFRYAGLAFIGAYGFGLIEQTRLPDMNAEVSLFDCIVAMCVALFLGLAALFGDRIVTKSLTGAAGFGSGVGPAVGRMVADYASAGISVLGGGGGGGGWRSGGGGAIGTISRSSHARRA